MADETIITKSTSELMAMKMGGTLLEPFVRKARSERYYDLLVSKGLADPELDGTYREHQDQFELYLNMYPEIRKKIEKDAMDNGWKVQYKGDSRNHGDPLAYREAYDRAYNEWYKANSEVFGAARDEAWRIKDQKKNPSIGGVISTYRYDDGRGNSFVPGGGYRVSPDGRRI